MISNNRRTFMLRVVAVAGSTAIASRAALAQTKLEETDPLAVQFDYKHDTTKANKAKYPKHEASQRCDNCQLFQGKAGDAWGPCALFAGKQVAGAGWCSAWVKKPA